MLMLSLAVVVLFNRDADDERDVEGDGDNDCVRFDEFIVVITACDFNCCAVVVVVVAANGVFNNNEPTTNDADETV